MLIKQAANLTVRLDGLQQLVKTNELFRSAFAYGEGTTAETPHPHDDSLRSCIEKIQERLGATSTFAECMQCINGLHLSEPMDADSLCAIIDSICAQTVPHLAELMDTNEKTLRIAAARQRVPSKRDSLLLSESVCNQMLDELHTEYPSLPE